MRAESLVFAVSGMLFGLIAGWIIGSQQAAAVRPAPPPAVQAAAPAPTGGSAAASAPPTLNEADARALEQVAQQDPKNARPRVQLGNLYFDAERYADAIRWYEDALTLNPQDANVSTDLGVALYYTNQPDRAIRQFEQSLAIDPRHTKTMLNMGIVKAFGKQDLAGATAAWQQVLAIAPDSPEGQAAKKALDGVAQAHPPGTTPGS